jgi:hypothetical protein
MRESPGGASRARLAAWQQTTFPALRPKPTPCLDEFADDLLADVEGVAVGDRAGAGAAQLTVGDRNFRPDDPEPAEVFMLGVATAVRAALRQWRRLLPIRLRGPVRWPWRPWASPRRRPGRAGSSFGSPLENGAA